MSPENMIKILQREINELKAIFSCISNTNSQKSFLEVADTFISISTSTDKRLVYVTTDETNNNNHSLYLYTGTQLKFLQTVI